jgi:ABC-type oligopeptide transport system ATPase subunit
MTPLVSLNGLTRDFASGSGFLKPRRIMRAVDDVSLDIPRGSVTGVVGESGCGKSTLGRLVLRLLAATSGSVTYDGVDIGSLSPVALRAMRRNMQMVFQDPYSAILHWPRADGTLSGAAHRRARPQGKAGRVDGHGRPEPQP